MTRDEAEAIIALVEAAIGTTEIGCGAGAYQMYEAARERLRTIALHNDMAPKPRPHPFKRSRE